MNNNTMQQIKDRLLEIYKATVIQDYEGCSSFEGFLANLVIMYQEEDVKPCDVFEMDISPDIFPDFNDIATEYARRRLEEHVKR